MTPLSDGAGTAVAMGSGVSRWKDGDRVSPNFFPGWPDGTPNECIEAGQIRVISLDSHPTSAIQIDHIDGHRAGVGPG